MFKSFHRGFTLIEILVVVIIIGITGAIIVPHIGTRDDLKAGAAARVMMADLIYAQNMAITGQQNYYLVFDVANKRYTITNASNTTINHPINKTSYVVQFGSGGTNGFTDMVLESAAFVSAASGATNTTLGFDELGAPLSRSGTNTPDSMASGSITIKCGTYRLRIDIEAYTGQITVTTL